MTEKAGSSDKLGISNALVIGACAFVTIFLAILFLDSTIRSDLRANRAMAVIGALSLSNLAITPSGRPQRAPEMLNPAVDLRFVPSLPPAELDTVDLLLKTGDTAVGEDAR